MKLFTYLRLKKTDHVIAQASAKLEKGKLVEEFSSGSSYERIYVKAPEDVT